MFPALQPRKKNTVSEADSTLKQHHKYWQMTKQLLQDSKLALLAKPNNELTSSILKVWKIREVPEFYGLYFLYFAAGASEELRNQLTRKQIEDTLSANSFYFRIDNKVSERQACLAHMQTLLRILVAFDNMNNNIPDQQGQHLIKQILADCRTLEEIKLKQQAKYKQLSSVIGQARSLTLNLINQIQLWRTSLATMHSSDMFERLNRVRIMFIKDGVNVMVRVLYDTGFMARSFLKKWVNFVDKNDPFFIEILKEMPENRIQTLVLEGLREIENSQVVMKMVYKLTQELNSTKLILPQTKSNKSSRRQSKESISTPRKESPKQMKPAPREVKQAKSELKSELRSELNIQNKQNKIEIIYKPKQKRASRPQSQTQIGAQPAQTPTRQQPPPRSSIADSKPSSQDIASMADMQELKRLSIERDKLERQLERERKLKQRQAEEYNRKLEKLDLELGRYKEEANKQIISKKELERAKEDLLRSKEHELRELRNQLKQRRSEQTSKKHSRAPSATERRLPDDVSLVKIYKASSKGFSSIKNKQQGEKANLQSQKQKLQKMLLSERKRQSKEISDYTRKLEEYDQQLNKVKEDRNAQKARIREIEKEKQERIRQKQTELLAIKKYMNEELKKKDHSKPISYIQYRAKHPPNNPDNEHIEQRALARKRIEQLYSSRSSKYESVQSNNSSNSRVKSIEIVYDKKNNELKTLAKQIKRTDRELTRLRGLEILEEEDDKKIQSMRKSQEGLKKSQLTEVYGQQQGKDYKLQNSRLLQKNKELEEQRNQLKLEKEKRQHELLLQKQALMKQYDEKMEAERRRYKREMEGLAETLKNREFQLLNQMRVELQEQKALREEKQRKLDDELRERAELQRQKAELEAERQRLTLEVEIKRLKENLEKQIREELIQINDIKKDEEDADAIRRLREEALQIQIVELEKMQNQELARLDEENDELRKALLSRKKKLVKNKTQEADRIGSEDKGKIRHQKTEPVELQENYELKARSQSKNYSELVRPRYQLPSNQQPKRVREYTLSSSNSKTQNLSSLLAQLNDKAQMQRVTTGELVNRFKKVQKQPQVAQADDIQGLVKLYQARSRVSSAERIMKQKKKSDQFLAAAINNQSKQQIIDSLMKNRKHREDFEKELRDTGAKLSSNYGDGYNELYFKSFMDLRVDAENNAISEYQQRHRHAINTAESYGGRVLETNEKPPPPPKTIREHIIVHQKAIDDQKASQKKNFFKINKDNLKPKWNKQEESKSLPKPAKLSEEVSKRQEEAMKKYIDRAKGKDQSKEKEKKKASINQNKPEKDKNSKEEVKVDKIDETPSKVIQVQKLDLSQPVSKQMKRPVQEQKYEEPHIQNKNISQSEKKNKKTEEANNPKLNNSKGFSEISDIKQRINSQKSEHNEQLSQLRIPTQKSQKVVTEQNQPGEPEPIEEYKEEESYYQHIKAMQQQKVAEKKAEQEKQRQIDLQRQKQEHERLKKLLQERQKQQRVVKYRGVIKDMLKLANYTVYQQVIQQSNLAKYLGQYEKLNSIDTQKINKFDLAQSLKFAQSEPSYHVLIAKDSHKIQKGIGMFRKSSTNYLCDHLTTHQLNTLSQVALSMCRFIFLNDPGCDCVEFQFNFDKADFEHANIYQSFQQLCMDYGEVYQRKGEALKRKYVVKRRLFVDEVGEGWGAGGMGVTLSASLYVGSKGAMLAKKIGQQQPQDHDMSQYQVCVELLLTEQIKTILSIQEFEALKQKIKNNLRLKQLLLTTVLMQKRAITVQQFTKSKYTNSVQVKSLPNYLLESLAPPVTAPISACNFNQSFPLNPLPKICRLSIDSQPISYLGVKMPAISATSSSYHSPSHFLTLSPQYKLLLMDANEFIGQTETNPEIDLFFYLKHYVKNIKDFKKQQYPTVYVPRVSLKRVVQHKQMGNIIQRSLVSTQQVRFGDQRLASSIRIQPSYKDLVVKCPFIMCILSGRLERAASGTPIYARLIGISEVI